MALATPITSVEKGRKTPLATHSFQDSGATPISPPTPHSQPYPNRSTESTGGGCPPFESGCGTDYSQVRTHPILGPLVNKEPLCPHAYWKATFATS